MKLLGVVAIAAGLVFAATAAKASTITFSVGEEDGQAFDSGTLTFDSANPTAGTITFTRFAGDEFSPPPFSASTVGPITISITEQGGALAIDASGTGTFDLGGGVTSGGTLSASAFFFPYDPTASTLDGFGSIGAQSTTGIAGTATNGTTLFGVPPLTTSPVPLPASAPLLGAAVAALGVAGAVTLRRATA